MKDLSLQDHLTDLRKAAIRTLIIISVSVILTYSVSDYISEILLKSLRTALQNGSGKIVYLGVFDKMVSQMQVSLWSGIVFSAPLWFREVWLFIKPGLYEKEIKFVRPFMYIGLILFWAGVLFGFFVVFPVTLNVLMQFGVSNVEANINLKDYIILSCKVYVFLGLCFQIPNVLLILGFLGVVNSSFLIEKRKYVHIALMIIAAVVSPPDVISMFALWIPLSLLYELGILAQRIFVRKKTIS